MTTTANYPDLPTAELTAKVERFVKPLIDGEVVSSLAIGLVDGDKTVILGYGSVAGAKADKPDGDTIYEIGSITKVFTGILLADMVERKEAQRNDPVAKYLPANIKMPLFDGTPITLLDLATQSSGLPRLPDNLTSQDPDNPYADYTPDKLLTFLSHYTLTRKPGEKYEYSNLGMGLLGYALAQHAKMPYAQLVQQRICEPLGMTGTTIALTPEQRPRLAAGHNVDGSRVKNWDFDALAGAGALRSNVRDMLRFLQANLKPNAGTMPPSLQRALKSAQNAQHPLDGPGQIGLAWHILPDGNTVWHNGGTGGYRSLVAFNREKGQGVVVLCDTASEYIDQAGFSLLRILNGEEPAPLKIRLPARVDTGIYERYAGRYQLAPGAILTVTREQNRLLAQLTGQAKYRLDPASETEFFYRIVEAQITFVKDGDGNVEKLILHQNGRDLPAPKIK